MSAKTKIVVLRKKEVFLAGVFTLAGLLLLVLFFFLFLPNPNKNNLAQSTANQEEETTRPLPSSTPTAVVSTNVPTATQSGILQETLPDNVYVPGIYKTELILGGHCVEVEAVLEKDRISSLRIVEPTTDVTTMYPLLEPTMEKIWEQIHVTQSLDNLELDSSAKYTSLVLLEAIRCCIEKGQK